MLWVLNQSDGRTSLLEIARRSELRYPLVSRAAELLEDAELLEAGPPEPDSAPVP